LIRRWRKATLRLSIPKGVYGVNRRALALAILPLFAALTVWALMNGGIGGILSFHQSAGGWQVFADLVIALVLLLTFLVPHARDRGRNPWPWVVLTLALGSFGPLLYLATAGQSGSGEGGRHR
jgi:drug/metabolite transporter (DMT)-like permease